ncbi:hypothetical protein TNCV_1583671 [Trichonephila clavipes]|nr:hypothetical protein TNCV_1583671 [Trichonephila clavipes]
MDSGRSTCTLNRKWCNRVHSLEHSPVDYSRPFLHGMGPPKLVAPGADRSETTQTMRRRLHEIQLRARVSLTRVPLATQHSARRLA